MTHYKKLVATDFDKDFRAVAKIVEAPLPEPRPGQVLVKIKYAGVNASDINLSAGVYFTDGKEPPFGLGIDFAGEVTALGEGVKDLLIGDKVIGSGIGLGYREYACVAASGLFKVPAIAPNSTALITSGLPAIIGLETLGEMRSNETVLITAAAGGVGHIAVQLAKLAGNTVIATAGSPEKMDFLRELGADRCVNYREEDLDTVLRKEFPNGLDLVFENVGTTLFDTALRHLAKRGRLVVCGAISEYQKERPEKITAPRIYNHLLFKSASIRTFIFSDFPEVFPEKSQKLTQLLLSGKLQIKYDPHIFEGLASVPDAVDYLFAGKNQGKVVVKI